MAEGNQYVMGSVKRLSEHINRQSVYAPALQVLSNDQVPSRGEAYVERILDGETVFWDVGPLAQESWEVYAGLSGFYGQFVRLLGRDIAMDMWPGFDRARWISSDWYPLGGEFGWKVACRPLPGIGFRHRYTGMPEALRYVSSWPHGWLSLEECRDAAPYVHRRVVELAIDLRLDWPVEDLGTRLAHPEELSVEESFELHNLCAGRNDGVAWQFERALVLLKAMRRAVDRERDLISVGY